MRIKIIFTLGLLLVITHSGAVHAQGVSYDPLAEWNGPHYHIINGTGQYALNNVDDPVFDTPFENPGAIAVWHLGTDYISLVVDTYNDRILFFDTNIAHKLKQDLVSLGGDWTPNDPPSSGGEFGNAGVGPPDHGIIWFHDGNIVPGSEEIIIDGTIYTRVADVSGYDENDAVYEIEYEGAVGTGGVVTLPDNDTFDGDENLVIEYAVERDPADGSGDIDYHFATAGELSGSNLRIDEYYPTTAGAPESFENLKAIAFNDNSVTPSAIDIYVLDAGDATEKLFTYKVLNTGGTFEYVSTYDGPLSTPADVDIEQSGDNNLANFTDGDGLDLTNWDGANAPTVAVSAYNQGLVNNHIYRVDVVSINLAAGDLSGGALMVTDQTSNMVAVFSLSGAGAGTYNFDSEIPGLRIALTIDAATVLELDDYFTVQPDAGDDAEINDYIFLCDTGNDRIKVIKGCENGEPTLNGVDTDFFAGDSRTDVYWVSDGVTAHKTLVSACRAEENSYTLYTGSPRDVSQSDWVQWTGVNNFSGSTSGDNHYMYDYDTRVMTLGDGVFGAIPTLADTVFAVYDESIDVLDYGTTGTGEGNFDSPQGIVARYNNSHGWYDLYVADSGNNRIVKLKFYPGNLSTPSSASMHWVTSWNSTSTTPAVLSNPTDLAVLMDNAGAGGSVYLFVCDTGNDRVIIYHDGEAEDDGGGGDTAPSYSNLIGGTGTTLGFFTNPRGVSLIDNGNDIDIYVVDSERGWVTKFQEGPTPSIDVDYPVSAGYPPNGSYVFDAAGSVFGTNAPDGAYIQFYFSATEDDPAPTLCDTTRVSSESSSFTWVFANTPTGTPADGDYYLYAWMYNSSGSRIAYDNSTSSEMLTIDSNLSQGLSIFDPLDDDRYLYLQNSAERVVHFTIDYPDSVIAANFTGTFPPAVIEIVSIEEGPAWQALQYSQTIFIKTWDNTAGTFEVNTSVLGSNVGLKASGAHVVAIVTVKAKSDAITTTSRVVNETMTIASGGMTDVNGVNVVSPGLRALNLRVAYLGDIAGSVDSSGSVPNMIPKPDGVIGFSDLVIFTIGWNGMGGHRDPIADLGPTSGSVPNLVALPDGKWDVYDLLAFTQMFNWYVGAGLTSLPLQGLAALGNPTMISSDVRGDGDEVTLSIDVNGVVDLMCANLTVNYDPAVYQTVSVDEGGFLSNGADLFFNSVENTGEVKIYLARLNGAAPSVSGCGELAEITFKAKGEIESDFTIFYDLRNRFGKTIESGVLSTAGSGLPETFKLEQNYPNPFNPETAIAFRLPKAAQVKLEVFNILGESVTVLIDEWLSAGLHRINWDGRSKSGETVSSGLYFYILKTGDFTSVKKMIMLK